MEHQDFKVVNFGKSKATIDKEKKEQNRKTSNIVSNNDTVTVAVADKQLGKIISSARTLKGKNQKELALEAGVSVQVLSQWESNKQVPTNAEIAKLEKILGVKLPRNKKKIIEN